MGGQAASNQAVRLAQVTPQVVNPLVEQVQERRTSSQDYGGLYQQFEPFSQTSGRGRHLAGWWMGTAYQLTGREGRNLAAIWELLFPLTLSTPFILPSSTPFIRRRLEFRPYLFKRRLGVVGTNHRRRRHDLLHFGVGMRPEVWRLESLILLSNHRRSSPMIKTTLPDSPVYGETAVQPPSHQGSEPLTCSGGPLRDAPRQQHHAQRHQGTTVLFF